MDATTGDCSLHEVDYSDFASIRTTADLRALGGTCTGFMLSWSGRLRYNFDEAIIRVIDRRPKSGFVVSTLFAIVVRGKPVGGAHVMDLDAATLFQRASRPRSTAITERNGLYIHPPFRKTSCGHRKLDRLLPDELRALVDTEVESAPKDPDGWRNLQLLTPGRDCNAIKSCLRQFEPIDVSPREHKYSGEYDVTPQIYRDSLNTRNLTCSIIHPIPST